MRTIDTLPAAKTQALISYESHLSREKDAHVTARLYEHEGVSLIVMTDESDDHKGTSVTNRIERCAFLAWITFERPDRCFFAEHYRGDDDSRSSIGREHVDLVDFKREPNGDYKVGAAYAGGLRVEQFVGANWIIPEKAAQISQELDALLDAHGLKEVGR